jgi:flagellar motor switch protein FliG
MLPVALRKAAILIASLDERTAESLLDQMGPEQAAKVRSAMVELDAIPTDEEQRVLAEFMQQQGLPAGAKAPPAGDSDVELEISSALLDEPPSPAGAAQPSESPALFLESVAPDQLARVLACEQPQTIAAVIAHLTPQQSAGVLEHLPPDLATDSLERLATLGPLAPAVLADLERELQRRLEAIGVNPRGKHCDQKLSAVIGAMDFRQRERVLLQLSRRNAALVGRLGLCPTAADLTPAAYQATACRYRLQQPDRRERKRDSAPQIAFADLARLSDRSLQAVFAAVDPAVALLALTGAEERLLNRVLRRLPSPERTALRQRLEHPGPVRLREIEQAQAQVAAVASQLARQGDKKRSAAPRFAATA